MKAKEYIKEKYGESHFSMVVAMDDLVSLYSIIEEYHQAEGVVRLSKDEIESMVDNEIPFDEDEAIADEYNRYFFKRGIEAAIKKLQS